MGGAENFKVAIDYDWKSHIRIDLLELFFGVVALELIDRFKNKGVANVPEHSGDRAGVTVEVIAVYRYFPRHYSPVKYLLRISLRS